MSKLPIGGLKWTPDRAALDNTGLTVLSNMIPGAPDHYRPLLAPVAVASAIIPGDLHPGMVIGVPPSGGTPVPFVAGSDGKRLYRVEGKSSAPVDVSRGGADYDFASGDRWRFVQYKGLIIATNFRDMIQAYDLGTGAATFVDLQPGNGSDIGPAPRARYIAVVRDFVCVASTYDDADLEVGNRVRWHGVVDGIPDPTTWDVSAYTQADFQDLSDLGNISGYTGGQFGLILLERGIVLQQFSGAYLFSFQTISNNIGCDTPGSVVQLGGVTYFLAPNGWYACDGSTLSPIGDGQINDWFLADFDRSSTGAMYGYADQEHGLLIWSYTGQGSSASLPNRMLYYSPAQQRWGIVYIELECIGPVLQYGLDLNDPVDFPDLNTDSRNLNDPRLWLINQRLGAIIGGYVQSFIGDPLSGVIETPELEADEGRRGMVRRVTVLQEGGTSTVQMGLREIAAIQAPTYTTVHSPQADGTIRCREAGRFFRARVTISGNWSKISAVEVDLAPLGKR